MSRLHDESEEFDMALQRIVTMWTKRKKYIQDLESTNRQNERRISDMDRQIRDLQTHVRSLQEHITALTEKNTYLVNEHAKVLSQLATSRRDTSSVYTAGASLQPIELERDYRDFVEQRIPNLVRTIQRYLKETIPDLDKSSLNSLKIAIQITISYYIFHEEYMAQTPQELSTSIMTDLKNRLHFPELSLGDEPDTSRESPMKDLEDLIFKGQQLTKAIVSSGGKLVFYQQGAQFSEEYHELISGPDTEAVIQYTITPAYVVNSVRLVEQSYLKPLQAAKVVTTYAPGVNDATNTPSNSKDVQSL